MVCKRNPGPLTTVAMIECRRNSPQPKFESSVRDQASDAKSGYRNRGGDGAGRSDPCCAGDDLLGYNLQA